MKNDCLFCAIAAGEIPSNKEYEDDLCYAFYDIAPQAPTHFLVIPKEHIGSVAEIGAENSAVVAHIFEVIAKLTKAVLCHAIAVVEGAEAVLALELGSCDISVVSAVSWTTVAIHAHSSESEEEKEEDYDKEPSSAHAFVAAECRLDV